MLLFLFLSFQPFLSVCLCLSFSLTTPSAVSLFLSLYLSHFLPVPVPEFLPSLSLSPTNSVSLCVYLSLSSSLCLFPSLFLSFNRCGMTLLSSSSSKDPLLLHAITLQLCDITQYNALI